MADPQKEDPSKKEGTPPTPHLPEPAPEIVPPSVPAGTDPETAEVKVGNHVPEGDLPNPPPGPDKTGDELVGGF